MFRIITSALVVAALLAGTGRVALADIRVEGGGAAISAVFFIIHKAFEEETGERLRPVITTPVKGLAALDKGKVDVATAAVASLDELVAMAAREGVKVAAPEAFQSQVVGTNHVLVLVNKINRVQELSKDQLKGIFTGKVTNWKDVGGEDMPIEVVWGKGTPGQNALFTRRILDGEPVTDGATRTSDYGSIRELVMTRPGAIGIDPYGFRMGAVNFPKTPDVSSPIIAVTKGAPSAKVKRMFDFIAATLSVLEEE